MKKHWIKKGLVCGIVMCLLTGCQNVDSANIDFLKSGDAVQEETEPSIEDTGFRIMEPGEYDSKDTAVVVCVREDEKKITLLNRIVNKQYTLSYDGITVFTDQYGEALSASQLVPGDIVDVNFQHIPKKCVSLSISPASWEQEVNSGFEMNPARGHMAFYGEVYTLAERPMILSGGEEIELTDLNERDVLSVKGIDNTIYSIIVEKGHGYLRLIGEEYFVGGFVEIGQKMAQRVTEDMLLTVPEGEYNIVVKNGSHEGSKTATIYRDEETILDVSDLKGEEVKTGKVFFTLSPADANVYIDGDKIDASTYVELEYGVHQMIVKAAGYETISQYLKVGQENANLNVEMEPDGSGTSEKASGVADAEETPDKAEEGESVISSADSEAESAISATDSETDAAVEGTTPNAATTENAAASETATGEGTWRVKVNAPASAEVYVDGNYVGLAPVSFPKKAGSHVISLRKNGYQTRSYTIQVDSEEKDMELSFSELVKKTDSGLLGATGLGTTGLDADAIGLGDGTWTNNILSQTLSGL